MSTVERLGQGISRRNKVGRFSAVPKIIEVVLIVLLGLVAARLFWLLFAPLPVADNPPPVVRATASSSQSIAKSPFGKIAAAPIEEEAQPLETVQETTLNLKLHGVMADDERSSAIIETDNNKQSVFFLDEEIADGVTLEAVYANQVTINRNGIIESLKLPKDFEDRPPVSPVQVSATQTPVNETVLPEKVSNLDGPSSDRVRNAQRPAPPKRLVDAVRFEPSRSSSGDPAMAIYSRGDKAFFEAQGLRDGDIVLLVDNKPVTNVVEVLSRLRNKRSVNVVVERNAVPVELTIAISPGREAADVSN